MSVAKSQGLVPVTSWSISGRVRSPGGQRRGAYRAIHLTIVRLRSPGTWLTGFWPRPMRKASARWHTIWGADMRPQRRALSGRTSRSRRRISVVSPGRARVFMAPGPSVTQKPLAPGLAERGQRPIAARFRHRHDLLEAGIAAQRVEGPASRQRRDDEVALGDGAPQALEPPFVLADVAELPALLEDGLRV